MTDALTEGWTLDPDFNSNPVKLDTVAFYHLVKLTDEEQIEMDQQPTGKYDDVTSIRSVPIAEADALLNQGYVILDTYAKTVTLIKKQEKPT